MKLLTAEIIKKLPPLGSKDHETDPVVQVKFFCPWNHWTWYGWEFDGEDIMWGWVYGDFPELGTFSVSELESIQGPMGLKIERDLHFQPKRLSAVMKSHDC